MAQRPMVACRKARRFSSRNLALRPGNFHVGGKRYPGGSQTGAECRSMLARRNSHTLFFQALFCVDRARRIGSIISPLADSTLVRL